MSVEMQLRKLVDELGDLPTKMRLCLTLMRSLYSENAMGSSSHRANQFRKLRDDTQRDAMVYEEKILPACAEVVSSIQSFFEYYSKYTFEEWEGKLSEVVRKVKGYNHRCREILNMQETMMKTLKVRQDEAKVEVAKLENLTEELERRRNEMEKTSRLKGVLAVSLFAVPYVSVIAVPLLAVSATYDRVKAEEEKENCKTNDAIVKVVKEDLIPALSAFIHSLQGTTGFFSTMENEITIFQKRGEASVQDAKKLHYITMTKKAHEVNRSCQQFYQKLLELHIHLPAISGNRYN